MVGESDILSRMGRLNRPEGHGILLLTWRPMSPWAQKATLWRCQRHSRRRFSHPEPPAGAFAQALTDSGYSAAVVQRLGLSRLLVGQRQMNRPIMALGGRNHEIVEARIVQQV